MENRTETVQFTSEDKKGVFSNIMQVLHTQEEFVLDFMNLFPPGATIVSRIIVTPGHVKRIVKALEDNINKYEREYDVIPLKYPESIT